ncbi:hypothetical protein G7072_15890 [Nocardioides sp. HDW12B]|uniref:type II secretion system F family protein n=1 Tax=Nocardioides sp. HDW12B TaxID=2714939 RepID=UPI001407889B|nr:hypothetical protein [Nocardioides sp. HDW12B]QIK67634.1 hypothetical protein G7072_15890 [Nocardioides sp. HDW12B]
MTGPVAAAVAATVAGGPAGPAPAVTPPALAAALLAATAAALLLPRPSAGAGAGAPGTSGPGAVHETTAGGRTWRVGIPLQVLLVAAGVVLVATLPLRRAVLAGVLLAVTVAVVRAVIRRRAAEEAEERRRAVVLHAEALLGELRAGLPVGAALARAVEAWPESAPAAAAARWGASVPDALRRLGQLPGAESVTRLAAVWQLCAGSGASLAVGVAHVLETARAEQATRHVVAAELASARATARMLGLMPVMILVAGQGIGAEPWPFLLDSWPGLVCLAAGSACALSGLWWIDRIAGRAARGAA